MQKRPDLERALGLRFFRRRASDGKFSLWLLLALGDFVFTLSVLCQFPETVTLVFISILKVIWEFQAFVIDGVLLLILIL